MLKRRATTPEPISHRIFASPFGKIVPASVDASNGMQILPLMQRDTGLLLNNITRSACRRPRLLAED